METTIVFPTDPQKISEGDSLEIRPFSVFNSASHKPREVVAIVAAAKDMAIGRQGLIPWRLPEDMAHFKQTTMGHPVIMGRKTWESLPKRPLPGRRNIIVTRNPDYQADGGEIAASPEAAIALCPPDSAPVIIGGGEIYRLALPYCTKAIITEVETEIPDADTFFPALPADEWKVTETSDTLESKSGLRYRFVTYSRR